MLKLEKLKVMVETSTELTSDARTMSERDRDYYDGYQWTSEEIAVLNQRKQPVITINRVKRKIDAMIGLEQNQRTDPRAYARNPQDQDGAEAATKALRYVEDNTRFDTKASEVFSNVSVEGYGGVEIGATMQRGQAEVSVTKLRWEELFYDPFSRERDFSDATYMGVMKWMDTDTAVAFYGEEFEGGEAKLREILETSYTTNQDGETYEDRPDRQTFRWSDRRKKRVRIVQMYYRIGAKWHRAVFCQGGEILNEPSPYLDEDGQPTNPMILFAAYVDRENRRYGVVRDMISAQDEINKRRSKLLHQLNSRQTIGVKGAVDSVTTMKRELAKPDGHVELNFEQFEDAIAAGVKPFEIVQNQDQTAGQFSLLTEAKGEIDMLGPNASLLGQLTGQHSGRAIMAQQQAGMAELAPLYDAKRDWRIRCYRAMWERIRQFWTEPRWVRVTDEMGAPEFVGFNVPVPTEFGMEVQNQPGRMDLDIIIDESPDHVTLQSEQFEHLAKLMQSGAQIPMEMLIEASALPNKQEVLEKIKEGQAGAAQQQQMMMQMQQQMAQMQQQLEMMKAQAKTELDRANAAKAIAQIEEIRSQTAENYADADKTRVETQLAPFRA